jgi:hypothetical protein
VEILSQIRDGVIDVVKVHNGMPFVVEVREEP